MSTIVLKFAAAAEAATGVALVVVPSLVTGVLLGAPIDGIGEIVARIAGLALIGLGVACWPSGPARQAQFGMAIYGVAAALLLAFVGVRGDTVGVLLWPAVAAHLILVVLLLAGRRSSGSPGSGSA